MQLITINTIEDIVLEFQNNDEQQAQNEIAEFSKEQPELVNYIIETINTEHFKEVEVEFTLYWAFIIWKAIAPSLGDDSFVYLEIIQDNFQKNFNQENFFDKNKELEQALEAMDNELEIYAQGDFLTIIIEAIYDANEVLQKDNLFTIYITLRSILDTFNEMGGAK